MTTTRDKGVMAGGLPKVAKYNVTADGDVLFTGINCVVLGQIVEDLVTGVSTDGGTSSVTLPAILTSSDTLSVNATGAGSVTVIYIELPDEGMTTFDT